MDAHRKILVIVIMAVFVIVASCAEFSQQTGTVKGGAVGVGVGGLAGALLDSSNPWRGGVIGAALGAVLGGTLGHISDHGAREAASQNKPVEYRTEKDGHQARYRAEPGKYDPETGCRKVKETVYEDGKLVRSQIREICDVQ